MRRTDMTTAEIALARKWLGMQDERVVPDHVVDCVVNGTFTHARIQLYLAWQRVKTEFRKAGFGRFAK